MKVRSIGYWLLLVGSLCLVWSANARPLCAGQDYPRHVTVLNPPSEDSGTPQKVDPATEADIRQLMDLAGTKATVTRTMNNMEESMRPLLLRAFPPGEYRERLVQLFFEKFHNKVNADAVMDLTVPVYAQYLTDDEVKQLIQFYHTPLGEKWISVQPKLQEDLQPRARAWGEQMGREALIEVLQEHPDLAEQLKDAAVAARQH
ncbi:MAG TPA: DUF2059 domain-containing protein [Terriglobia bacterium]|nr:DUF2059 domain-containing protein [Terriglobia bacterium]